MPNGLEQSGKGSTAQPSGKFVVWLWGHARRVTIFVIGATVVLIGIAMIVLPGPAVIVIPLGLAILATEFVWARKWLECAKRQANRLATYATKDSQNGNDPTREK